MDNRNCPNNDLKTGVNIFRSGHSAIFKTASTYLSTVISCPFPENQPSSVRYARRRKVKSSGRGGRGGRSGLFEGRGGHGRGVRGGHVGRGTGNKNQSENGVDISNPTRWYGKE